MAAPDEPASVFAAAAERRAQFTQARPPPLEGVAADTFGAGGEQCLEESCGAPECSENLVFAPGFAAQWHKGTAAPLRPFCQYAEASGRAGKAAAGTSCFRHVCYVVQGVVGLTMAQTVVL